MIRILTDLFGDARRSVTHLEMRDAYGTPARFQAWRDGASVDQLAASEHIGAWIALTRSAVARGVGIRRARIVSEPVSDYIRYEFAVTEAFNLAGGEQVRWLPRPQAADLALPGCDFWQIDDGLVCFVFQTGDGDPAGHTISDDPGVMNLCGSAFDAVWHRAIDHKSYRLG